MESPLPTSRSTEHRANRQSRVHLRCYTARPVSAEYSRPLPDWDTTATSNLVDETKNGVWRIFPMKIPVKTIAIWVYASYSIIPLVMIPAMEFMRETPDPNTLWIAVAFAALSFFFISPMTVAFFYYFDQAIGDDDYLQFDEKKQIVTLPRLDVSFHADRVCEVISVQSGDTTEVTLVVDETDTNQRWTQYPVCPVAAYTHEYGRKLALKLGMKCQEFRFSNRQLRQWKKPL